jgi:hypothetical protein
MPNLLRICSRSHRTRPCFTGIREKLSSVERAFQSSICLTLVSKQRTSGLSQHANIFLYNTRGDGSADGGDLATYTIRLEEADAECLKDLQVIDSLGLRVQVVILSYAHSCKP